jgi:hypothetical protein
VNLTSITLLYVYKADLCVEYIIELGQILLIKNVFVDMSKNITCD